MCQKLFKKAWSIQSLKPVEKLILLNLSFNASAKGTIQIEQKDIANKCAISIKSVYRNMKSLKEKRLLTYQHSHNEEFARIANIYQLTI